MSEVDKALKDAEDNLNAKASQMGRLKVEFDHNNNALTESYYPKMRPLKVQVYQSLHQRHFLEKEIQWKEKVLEKMRQLGKDFNEETSMAREREEELILILPRFQDAVKSLESLQSPSAADDMKVLRQYEYPPQLVLETMEAVLTLKGEYDTSWEEAKVILSDAYFFGFFLQKAKTFDKDNVSEDILMRLEPVMLNPDFEAVNVSAASIPCGALCKWVRAIYDYAKTKQIIQVTGLPEEDIRTDVEKLKEALYFKKEEIQGAEQKLAGLKAEFSQRKKELKARYDHAMGPLQETFFEAHHQYGATFASHG